MSGNFRDMERKMFPPAPQKKLLNRRAVGQRYGRDPRTIKRWKDAGVIPPPDARIQNRDYWSEDKLDHHDRQSVAERATAPQKAATA
jgi:hypothetical protein